MKDQNDNLTTELLETKARRGRPASGKALSNAERQARFRAKHPTKTREELRAVVIEELQYWKDRAREQAELGQRGYAWRLDYAALGIATLWTRLFPEHDTEIEELANAPFK